MLGSEEDDLRSIAVLESSVLRTKPPRLTRILNYMAVRLELLQWNLRTPGEKENIPILVPHRD